MVLLLVGVVSACAITPGDEVVVVFNSRLPESKELALYYAAKRQVPTNQIFGFDLPKGEEMTRAEFREQLQQPLARMLESNKLWHIAARTIRATNNQPAHVEWNVSTSKIRYAVLCYGVPLRVQSDPGLKEEGMDKLRPEMRRNEAAVDSELALLPLIDQHLPLSGPLRNPVYATTNSAFLHPTNGVLLVARLDGPTPAIARGLIDKALLAEAEGLWGRAYVDVRNTTEPGYKQGDEWIRNAGEICKHLGFETVVDENPGTFPTGFPMSQIALYFGWYTEHVSGPFTRPEVEFMPGAVAYHLHSFSANTLRSTNQYWVGPLLAKGVTATMGCVAEPYLAGTPEVAVFAARLIYNGFTFGESACASQPVLSWQITVVGDPLYHPFGRNPESLHDELYARHDKHVEWSFLRLLNLNLISGKPVTECVALLENLGLTKESAVLTEKLGDLYGMQGKPASAIHAWEEALKLNHTPQQSLRLRLELGEKLAGADRSEDALNDYEQLLREIPDYPDKLSVYRKMLPLAQKLNKKTEADRYQAEIQKLTLQTKS